MTTNPVQPAKKRKKVAGGDIAVFLILTFIAIIIYAPFHNTIVTSFQTAHGYGANPGALWPTDFTWDNYAIVLKDGSIQIGYMNSFIVTFFGTVLSMVVTTMFSYGLSRTEMPGRKALTIFMMITMYFSGGTIPTFLLFKSLNLMNTLTALILFGSVSGYNCLLIRNAFSQVPISLEEAAKLDGAGDVTIFTKIMLPLMKPILTTFTLFAVVRLWNDWYWPMLLINETSKTTLQVVLRTFVVSSYSSEVGDTNRIFSTGTKMASLVLTIIPIMCVYPYLQRYFVKGVMIGAVKD